MAVSPSKAASYPWPVVPVVPNGAPPRRVVPARNSTSAIDPVPDEAVYLTYRNGAAPAIGISFHPGATWPIVCSVTKSFIVLTFEPWIAPLQIADS